jgi:hypothetical protein
MSFVIDLNSLNNQATIRISLSFWSKIIRLYLSKNLIIISNYFNIIVIYTFNVKK